MRSEERPDLPEAPNPGEPTNRAAAAATSMGKGAAIRVRHCILLALSIAGAFVLTRLLVAGHGDLSRFIVVGTAHADPTLTPSGVHVVHGPGYDGQFYFRMALDPTDLSARAHGITLDLGLRRERIGYPVAVWCLSFGQPGLAVAAMVVVNLVAVGALAGLGASVAYEAGKHPAWGFVLLGFPGLVVSLARDLTELSAGALLVAGMVLAQRRRHLAAAVSLSVAVLTRETIILYPLAVAIARTPQLLRRRGRPGIADVEWLLPGIAFLGWQVICRFAYGSFPLSSESVDGAVPGSAFLDQLRAWVTQPSRTHLLDLAVLASLVLVVGLASRCADADVAIALVLFTALACSLSGDVWNGDLSELRVLAEIHLLAMVALLRAPPGRLRLAAVLPTGVLTGLFVVQFTGGWIAGGTGT